MKTTLCLLFVAASGLTSFGQYTSTETLKYYSEYFKEDRQLKISLPKNYAETPNRRYRVIYLFDAQSASLYDFTKATLAFFPGYASFYFDPVILVGIETKDRHFEFLPKHVNTVPDRKIISMPAALISLRLSIKNEVKPLIEKKYRANGFSVGIGHSLGGTFVTYSMLTVPDIFNAGICISPNFAFDDEAILSTFTNADKSNYLSQRFLYVAYGKGDETEEKFKPSTIKFGKLLQKSTTSNLTWKVDALDNTDHSTTPMEGIFKGLVFVNSFMNLPYEKYKGLLNSDGGESLIDFVKQYFAAQSRKAGTRLPGIGELNSIAYNAFSAGKKKEAIQLLEWGIALYPDDANLYDSLGEMEQSAGDMEEAKSSYQRGRSVVESQKDLLPGEAYQSKMDWFNKRLERSKVK